MDRVPFNSGPPPWAPLPSPQLPPYPPSSASFWTSANVHSRLKDVHDTLNLAKALKKELEMLIRMKEREGSTQGEDKGHDDLSTDGFHKFMKDNMIKVECQESLSHTAVNAIMSQLRFQLEPFKVATDSNSPWEEQSSVKRLADKMAKHKRNKFWRKRKRRRMAENLVKEREQFDQIDKEADEWRAREIAKGIAQRKVEKMKEIAKLKAKEEKKKLESELEMVLIVEKLKELRTIRVQKLKKQGHFLPEEDDKFLEQVKAAVEEEERRAMVPSDVDVAKDPPDIIEETRERINPKHTPDLEDPAHKKEWDREIENQNNEGMTELVSKAVFKEEHGNRAPNGASGSTYESNVNLPLEFYHYYHGSNADMGTLIEVRRTWDAYIRPGGSRIPGHLVKPPPPADETWASYLVKPKTSDV